MLICQGEEISAIVTQAAVFLGNALALLAIYVKVI